jgi:hypothetical protein
MISTPPAVEPWGGEPWAAPPPGAVDPSPAVEAVEAVTLWSREPHALWNSRRDDDASHDDRHTSAVDLDAVNSPAVDRGPLTRCEAVES